MTVLDPDLNAGRTAARSKKVPRQRDHGVRVEPLLALEWSHAIETAGGIGIAAAPAESRRAWIHRADEQQVLAMYRAVRAVDANAPAPWWLRALDRGRLPSRAAGFAVEDEVSELLLSRPGWVYVPWAAEGEVGYWEFVPSESGVYGPAEPTTVQFTDRHPGWVDLLPAHRGPGLRQPIEFTAAELREQIEDLENIA
ncbi:hypothetical protein [Saccharothrix coeruleofusca]|uniref:Uncharacterized protein n=1 Tax=Saccharothrix coeruleofusca TaxID=33919 RepID=A0A918AH68_9PSEU|nr:hypothetical protein [Saccharothrix coeruleofusca]GGP38973.1 hypothetical protein GCM10010185_08130 [Saccharothrix coeruleofusca]